MVYVGWPVAQLIDFGGQAGSNLVSGLGTNTAVFTMPGNVGLKVESVVATVNNAAGAATTATLTIADSFGAVIAKVPTSTSIPAAGSGTVTYALRLFGDGGTTLTPGSGIPPFPAIDDYVFKTTTTTVTAIGHADNSQVMIQGNAISLDGSTRVKIEYFVPGVELTGSPPNNQAVGFELWDGATDKGTIGFVIGNRKGVASSELDVGGPVYGAVILTPSAGTHTYAINAWKAIAGGTCVVIANTMIDGTGNFAPMWYRVTST